MASSQDKLHEFLGKANVDFGATFKAAWIRIGDNRNPMGRALCDSTLLCTPASLSR
jgi:hypothetical protein